MLYGQFVFPLKLIFHLIPLFLLFQVWVYLSSSHRESYCFCCSISYSHIDDTTATIIRLLVQFWFLCCHCPCFPPSQILTWFDQASYLKCHFHHIHLIDSVAFDSFFKEPWNYVWWFIKSIHHYLHALVEYWCSYWYSIEYWAPVDIFITIHNWMMLHLFWNLFGGLSFQGFCYLQFHLLYLRVHYYCYTSVL